MRSQAHFNNREGADLNIYALEMHPIYIEDIHVILLKAILRLYIYTMFLYD